MAVARTDRPTRKNKFVSMSPTVRANCPMINENSPWGPTRLQRKAAGLLLLSRLAEATIPRP